MCHTDGAWYTSDGKFGHCTCVMIVCACVMLINYCTWSQEDWTWKMTVSAT